MTLKLNGSTSGSVSIDAPASTTGGADRTVTCPDATGTMALTSNICFSSYAILEDQKSQNTQAGGYDNADGWVTRELNTEVADPDSIVSISSNEFTLGAGNYLIKWSCPFYRINQVLSRLYDVTNSAVKAYSQAGYGYSSSEGLNQITGNARVTPTGSTAYKIEMKGESDKSNNGLGLPTNYGTEVYLQVEIYKEAS